MKIPLLYKVEVGALKSAMAAAPGTALLVLAIVWSLGAFVWRQIRKKQEYEWRDIFKGESLEAYYGRIIQNTAYHR